MNKKIFGPPSVIRKCLVVFAAITVFVGGFLIVNSAFAADVIDPIPQCIGAYNEILGTSGDDTITGTPGNDFINVGEGNNTVTGGGGNDCIVAGSGNDTITTTLGGSVILAGDGNNTITSR